MNTQQIEESAKQACLKDDWNTDEPFQEGFKKGYEFALSQPLPEKKPLGGITERHPEDYCHLCGKDNIMWYAENELYNEVMGNTSGSGIMCHYCFIEMSNDKGIDVIFNARRLNDKEIKSLKEISDEHLRNVVILQGYTQEFANRPSLTAEFSDSDNEFAIAFNPKRDDSYEVVNLASCQYLSQFYQMPRYYPEPKHSVDYERLRDAFESLLTLAYSGEWKYANLHEEGKNVWREKAGLTPKQ